MTHPPKKGLLIRTDGTYEYRDITGYQDIIAAVGGDFDWTAQSDIICYCYEWALYERPQNPVATAIFWAHNGPSTPLAGPVLIMGKAGADGDETDVPPSVEVEAERSVKEFGENLPLLAVELTEEQKDGFREANAVAYEDIEVWIKEQSAKKR